MGRGRRNAELDRGRARTEASDRREYAVIDHSFRPAELPALGPSPDEPGLHPFGNSCSLEFRDRSQNMQLQASCRRGSVDPFGQ